MVDSSQQQLVLDMLEITMSERGIRTVTGEYQTNAMDSSWSQLDNYIISIFGTPSMVEPWGWKFEGWHVSMHFTIVPTKCDIMIMPMPV
jgi:hypothetical protein